MLPLPQYAFGATRAPGTIQLIQHAAAYLSMPSTTTKRGTMWPRQSFLVEKNLLIRAASFFDGSCSS